MRLDTPKITVVSRQLSPKSVEIQTNLILLVPAGFKDFEAIPYGETLKARLAQRGHDLATDPFTTDLPNALGTRASVSKIDAQVCAFDLLELARGLVAGHAGAKRLAVAAVGLDDALAARGIEAVVAAALAADFNLPSFKSKAAPSPVRLREIACFGPIAAARLARTAAEAKGNNLARYLTALPVNELTPGKYRARVETLAREYGWDASFLDTRTLRARGAGAFLAVARGSGEDKAGILHLRYRARGKGGKGGKKARGAAAGEGALALVGKGICFDTGGTNLKSAKHMFGMHEDMEGSAVALGALLALTEMKVDFPVDCWLALAQNDIGPGAYRQNEVVRAINGTTIEIVHTDAEGRLVLADTLALACAAKPSAVIDYATLTGACIGALGTRLSGALTNREALIAKLIDAGRDSGERVWPFPLDKDYEKDLKSEVADIKQCTLGSDADQILAAVFLRKFLSGDPAWVHVDLAAGNNKGGLAHIPTDVTGFGVRFTLNLLFEQRLLSGTS